MIVENEMLLINIEVTGNPPPSITWQKNGEDISDPRVMISGSTLSISSVQHSDAGRYTVTAQNAADTVQISYRVIVQCKL